MKRGKKSDELIIAIKNWLFKTGRKKKSR